MCCEYAPEIEERLIKMKLFHKKIKEKKKKSINLFERLRLVCKVYHGKHLETLQQNAKYLKSERFF